MTLRIVRLGTPRHSQEGTRIGAVRRPPRGVRKECYGDGGLVRHLVSRAVAEPGVGGEGSEWNGFVRSFRAEMNKPTPRRTLDLIAALSRDAHFSVGCYCENETRCHRSVLRELLAERGTSIA